MIDLRYEKGRRYEKNLDSHQLEDIDDGENSNNY